MKSFTTHLQEAAKKKVVDPNITICDLLKLDPDTVIRLIGQTRSSYRPEELNDKTTKHLEALIEWLGDGIGGSSKAPYMKYIQTMAACPKKSSWATWQGTAYRGAAKSKEWVKTNLKFTGETAVKQTKLYATAEAVYQSQFAAQSWTENWKIATRFATGYSSGSIPLVFETQLNRNNTLFSPEFLNKCGWDESEVIRVENTPTKMKVYFPISDSDMLIGIGFKHRPTRQNTNNPVKFLRDGYMKELSKVFGEANAKKLLSIPKVLSRIADITGYKI